MEVGDIDVISMKFLLAIAIVLAFVPTATAECTDRPTGPTAIGGGAEWPPESGALTVAVAGTGATVFFEPNEVKVRYGVGDTSC